MAFTPPQVVFAAISAIAVGQLAVVAPAGRLVATPDPVKAEKNPSIRAGSAHHSTFFFSGSGGYHGGK